MFDDLGEWFDELDYGDPWPERDDDPWPDDEWLWWPEPQPDDVCTACGKACAWSSDGCEVAQAELDAAEQALVEHVLERAERRTQRRLNRRNQGVRGQGFRRNQRSRQRPERR